MPTTLAGLELSGTLPEAAVRLVAGNGPEDALEHQDLLEELQGFLSSHDLLADCSEARAALKKEVPSSHYYVRSLSWTSRTFYFLDSRDLLEVLRDFLGRDRGGGSLGDPPGP